MALTEKAFMQQVIDLAHLYSWLCYHTYDSRRSAPGFPDLGFCHVARGEFFLAELKTQRGRLSRVQATWIAALRAASVECYVWRPSDFDTIVTRLTGAAIKTIGG